MKVLKVYNINNNKKSNFNLNGLATSKISIIGKFDKKNYSILSNYSLYEVSKKRSPILVTDCNKIKMILKPALKYVKNNILTDIEQFLNQKK